jgi:hypothetical protein
LVEAALDEFDCFSSITHANRMARFWKQCADYPIGNCDCLVVKFEEFNASLEWK